MKARLIQQSALCASLAATVCIWGWQTSSAGGPPVRLAVLEARPIGPDSADPAPDEVGQLDRQVPDLNSITGLIPTHWEPNSQLIPTEIEARALLIQTGPNSGVRRTESSPPTQQGEINAFLNQQILSLTPRNSPSTADLGSWTSPARVTGGTRVATVPKSINRRR